MKSIRNCNKELQGRYSNSSEYGAEVLRTGIIYDGTKYNAFSYPFMVTTDLIKSLVSSDKNDNLGRHLVPVYFIEPAEETLVGFVEYDVDLMTGRNFECAYVKMPIFTDSAVAAIAKHCLLNKSFSLQAGIDRGPGEIKDGIYHPTSIGIQFFIIVASDDKYVETDTWKKCEDTFDSVSEEPEFENTNEQPCLPKDTIDDFKDGDFIK